MLLITSIQVFNSILFDYSNNSAAFILFSLASIYKEILIRSIPDIITAKKEENHKFICII